MEILGIIIILAGIGGLFFPWMLVFKWGKLVPLIWIDWIFVSFLILLSLFIIYLGVSVLKEN